MPPPPRLKILLAGDEGCGKTCLIRRFVEGAFTPRYVPTIGVDFGVHPVPLPGGATARANLYDLSGSPHYAMVRAEFYREADGLLLVVDARGGGGCLAGAAAWLAEAMGGGLRAGVPVLLCGTKAEGGGGGGASARALAPAEGAAWAAAHLGARGGYYAASALTGEGVGEAVGAIVAAAAEGAGEGAGAAGPASRR